MKIEVTPQSIILTAGDTAEAYQLERVAAELKAAGHKRDVALGYAERVDALTIPLI